MRIGSLFSGAGGLDLAVESVFGATTAWHAEIDPAASKVLARRFPDVPNLGSVTDIDWTTVEPVGVLCGGFPCQDVSTAGRRAGMAKGTRSGLWSEMAGAIAILGPRYVVIENVRGLLNATAHRPMEPEPNALGDRDSQPVLRAIGAVLGDLADLGYDAQWSTVAASSVGAPHRRERVFIVATDATRDGRDEGRPEPARFVGRPHAALGGPADGVDLLPTPTTQDGANCAGPSQFDRNSLPLNVVATLLPTPTPAAADGNGGKQRSQDALDGANGKRSIDLPNIARLLPTPRATDPANATIHSSEGFRPQLGEVARTLLPTPNASDGTGGGIHPDKRIGRSTQLIDHVTVDATAWGKYAEAITRWENITRPAPAPTEPNRNGNPRLNPRFSEWMMGWPGGHVTDVPGITRNDALRIIGNGVCPQQAHAALTYLLNLTVIA